MSKDLSLFDFNGLQVRVVDLDGSPWFVAADVCRALGMPMHGGTLQYLARLGEDERKLFLQSTLGQNKGSFPNRGAVCLSESGLYKFILRSDKPQARAFQDWVTRIVLPTIRKDGMYVAGEEKVATGEMSADELILRAHELLMAKVKRLETENVAMSDELNLITVDEYRALRHVYWLHAAKTRLGIEATRIAQASPRVSLSQTNIAVDMASIL